MSPRRTHYDSLGVSPHASPDEIKGQFRKMALELHPDKNKSPDAAEHFKKINEAYEVLGNEKTRRIYDEYRLGRQSPGQEGSARSGLTWEEIEPALRGILALLFDYIDTHNDDPKKATFYVILALSLLAVLIFFLSD